MTPKKGRLEQRIFHGGDDQGADLYRSNVVAHSNYFRNDEVMLRGKVTISPPGHSHFQTTIEMGQ